MRFPAPTVGGRINPQKWLRKLHAWTGLALATVVLLFAVTGFLLNHRDVMKIPALQRQEVRELVSLADMPATPQALLVQLALPLDPELGKLRTTVEAAREMEWEGRRVRQPERWRISHDTPSLSTRVEYWVGGSQAEVVRTKPNLWLHLARLHMAIGTGPGWILLADAVAIALAALSLSGFWLWGRLHGSALRLGVLALGGGALVVTLALLAG